VQICLNHCYRVSDAGIQWVVGSCYSTQMSELDLSNTDLTGNCFLRKMPHLTKLRLDCCSSLNGQGLQNISASCKSLKWLSLALNKQLSDEDLKLAFKAGLENLNYFNASYTNINGFCFKDFKSFKIKTLILNSCPKVINLTHIFF
jgi:hypothetical protein